MFAGKSVNLRIVTKLNFFIALSQHSIYCSSGFNSRESFIWGVYRMDDCWTSNYCMASHTSPISSFRNWYVKMQHLLYCCASLIISGDEIDDWSNELWWLWLPCLNLPTKYQYKEKGNNCWWHYYVILFHS